MALIGLRYDLRRSASSPVAAPALYQACLEQCGWADGTGIDYAVISEHHGAPDGYLPAPLTLAAAIVGRTRRLPVTVAALLLPLHDPVRVAEEMAVLDLLGGGRVTLVLAAGYRPEEFAMAGVSRSSRCQLLEEYVAVLLQAWTGEPFEWRGRSHVVTPAPASQPHPPIMLGGSSEAAARRAARLRIPFFPAVADPRLAEAYAEEAAAIGFAEGFASLPVGPGFVHVTDDPERDWERLAPFITHDATTYDSWQTPDVRSDVHVRAHDLDGIRRSGVYRVVTPEECVALAEEVGSMGSILLHPLLGGMPPEWGWASLELFAKAVLPKLRAEPS